MGAQHADWCPNRALGHSDRDRHTIAHRYRRVGSNVFQDLSAWLEGDRVVAPLSHGLGVSIAAFIAAIVAHPKVTAKDATAWPKPLRS
jgi:homoserine kinase